MKKLFAIFVFFMIASVSQAQPIERKIVISHNTFFYTTIDVEFQLATLHKGNISSALNAAKDLALPAGRNYDQPIVPFSWDVLNNTVYAVNFLAHPMNDKNEALKRFPISGLQEWSDKITMTDMLMKSVDQNMFAYNDPYMFVLKRSNILDHFFYDAIAINDSSYLMAIANNGELSIWNYNGTKWEHGNIIQLKTDDYFTLFPFGKKVYMALSSGDVYEVTKNNVIAVPGKTIGEPLSNGFIILNKDDNSVCFMKNSQLDKITPLNKQIKKKAIKIF